jgi:four helix bundle protein
MHNFKELKVWKAGIDISKITFQLCRDFPLEEKYGLISQMVRAAVSIPSNIAEGCGRKSNKELHQFLNVALGSSFELETQFIIAKEFEYISEETSDAVCTQINEIQRMIRGFQKSLVI